MLASYGDTVGFTLAQGRRRSLDAPKRAWMLFDDDGKSWPTCSLLIMAPKLRDTRDATDDETSGLPREWLGNDYEAERSLIALPPKPLASWTLVGPLARIWYHRRGYFAPDFFKHAFNKPTGLRRLLFLVRGKKEVLLYRRRNTFRVELGEGCMVTRSGLEVP